MSELKNMAAIAIKIMTHQCLERRIPDRTTMERETKAWMNYRNETAKPIDWQFKTKNTCIKLRSLYPSIQSRRDTKVNSAPRHFDAKRGH